MFLFALDNLPPFSIMLISGDVDFAPALHILGQHGYTVILVIPSRVGDSSAVCNAGMFVCDWPSVACCEGFVPPTKSLMPPREASADVSVYFVGCHINYNTDAQNEEEAIIYRGTPQSYYKSRDFSIVSQSLSLSEYTSSSSLNMSCFPSTMRTQSLPPGLNEGSGGHVSCGDQNGSAMWVPPGDINGLRAQMMRLLELSGSSLPLTCVPSEYQKLFGRPLYMSEYGAYKLVNLFKKLGDSMAVEGKGQRKFVYLGNWKAGPSAILARKDMRGKGNQQQSMNAGGASSDEFSGDERVVVEENDKESNHGKSDMDDQNLREFKHELQEIWRAILVRFSSVVLRQYTSNDTRDLWTVEGLMWIS